MPISHLTTHNAYLPLHISLSLSPKPKPQCYLPLNTHDAYLPLHISLSLSPTPHSILLFSQSTKHSAISHSTTHSAVSHSTGHSPYLPFHNSQCLSLTWQPTVQIFYSLSLCHLTVCTCHSTIMIFYSVILCG